MWTGWCHIFSNEYNQRNTVVNFIQPCGCWAVVLTKPFSQWYIQPHLISVSEATLFQPSTKMICYDGCDTHGAARRWRCIFRALRPSGVSGGRVGKSKQDVYVPASPPWRKLSATYSRVCACVCRWTCGRHASLFTQASDTCICQQEGSRDQRTDGAQRLLSSVIRG